jgi:phage terminase small subunit
VVGVRKPLSARAQLYCAEYLIDLNQTAAAIRAGYSARSARDRGHNLMQDPRVLAEIARLQAARAARTEVTQDYVIARLVQNLDRALQAVPMKNEKGEPTGTYLYAGGVANRALHLLGLHLGMFTQRHEVTGKFDVGNSELANRFLSDIDRLAKRLASRNPGEPAGNGAGSSNGGTHG